MMTLYSRTVAVAFVAALFLPASPVLVPSPAAAGNPTFTNAVPESAALSLHAKISAVNPEKRWVTLTGPTGKEVTVVAGPAVRLEMLKVGDRVNARYYREVGFIVSTPTTGNSTPRSDDEVAAMLARPLKVPGGAAAAVTRVSGTVVGLDLADNTVDLVNPSGGGIYSFVVTNPARIRALRTLKIGDTITVVVSEAVAVQIEPAKQGLF